MPELGANTPLQVCLSDGKAAGYAGFELGHKFPRDATILRELLLAYHHHMGTVVQTPSDVDALLDVTADERVGRIWNAIEYREQNENEDWLIVVTTDHGRDTETGKSHGGQDDRERSRWIVTNSQNLNANFSNNSAVVDILPSIATHLELGIPSHIEAQLEGRSFVD